MVGAVVQRLGLSAAGLAAYHDRLNGPHDFDVAVDVLSMNERLLGQATLLDGQVNVQRDGPIHRTASLTLSDPDHALNLDGQSVQEGGVFGDRLIRVRHMVDVPGYGTVTATPIVGAVASLERDGIELQVELQDKTSLAVRGTRPHRVKKGMNAVAAWVEIMTECTGEFRFQVPSGTTRRLPHDFSTGWADDASPWAVCGQIADFLDRNQSYTCDGVARLAATPINPVYTFDTDVNVTTMPTGANDWADAINYVRVTGGATKKNKHPAPGIAQLPDAHPNSSWSLRRQGVRRYLPIVDTDGKKRYADRKRRANRILAREAPMNADMGWSVIPVFHLDHGDRVRLVTPDGATTVAFAEGSIPLGVGGDMTVGSTKVVSRSRARV